MAGAGSATSASRLGLKLQDYDQVIALSQANINQSLEYTFIAYYDEFSKFDVAIDSLGISMNGILSPPTVRLIDENGADRAIFTVCFESGTYCYSWRPPRPEGQKKFPAAIEEEKPINGWKMSFYVDFSLKKITTITDKTILEKLLHPNSYSVEQLMIDFGSTDLSTFALDKSEFPGMEGQTAAEKIANDANIKQFADAYIGTLVKNNKRNVLGYAVTVKSPQDAQIVSPEAPTLPPTKVRLQTINHRPGGLPSNSSIDNPFNAFLFTEVTGRNEMPTKDLEWSGDWFYGAFGGTMAMSKANFWEYFILGKVRSINVETVYAANKIANYLSMKQFPESTKWWLNDRGEPAASGTKFDWVTQDSKTKRFTWNDEKSHSTKTELNVLMDKATEYKVVSETSVTISPLIGEGKVRLNFLIKLDTDLKQYLKGTGALASATIFTHVNITWTTDLIFRSVSSGGLQVAAQNTAAPIISVTSEVKEGGALSDVLKALRDLCKIDNVKDEVNKLVKEFVEKTTVWNGISKSIETALNGQNKFIFPGGGTFEMKDPIFSNNCDLLIGLSYKKGESA